MFFFSPFMSLIKPWKIGVNREKIGTKPWKNRCQKSTIFSPLVFHRLRLLEFSAFLMYLVALSCLWECFLLSSGQVFARYADLQTPGVVVFGPCLSAPSTAEKRGELPEKLRQILDKSGICWRVVQNPGLLQKTYSKGDLSIFWAFSRTSQHVWPMTFHLPQSVWTASARLWERKRRWPWSRRPWSRRPHPNLVAHMVMVLLRVAPKEEKMMTMTKMLRRKPRYAYGHGHLQITQLDCDCDLWFELRIANH